MSGTATGEFWKWNCNCWGAIGTIAAVFGTPSKHEITIYRATVTEVGAGAGWSVERLCDDALRWGGLTLASCPRAPLVAPPTPDPFRPR